MRNRFDLTTSRNLTKPSKACSVCGGTILWRRWLDRDWEKIRYCGAVCRRVAVSQTLAKAA